MVIAVDFDGTITERNCFPDIAPIRKYAAIAINNLQAVGHCVVLWTCRESLELDKARHFLNENGIEMNAYNYSPYSIQSRKIVADIYIDDKNVFMVDDVDWYKIEKYILGLEDKTVKII